MYEWHPQHKLRINSSEAGPVLQAIIKENFSNTTA